MISQVRLAELVACEAHKYQKRRYTGLPYFTHLQAVTDILIRHGQRLGSGKSIFIETSTEQGLAAAWLHDTKEDGVLTEEFLKTHFDFNVCRLVMQLTNVDKSMGNRAYRHMLDTERLSKAWADAQTIKYADILSNIVGIATSDPSFAALYLVEKEEQMKAMTWGYAPLREEVWEKLSKEMNQLSVTLNLS